MKIKYLFLFIFLLNECQCFTAENPQDVVHPYLFADRLAEYEKDPYSEPGKIIANDRENLEKIKNLLSTNAIKEDFEDILKADESPIMLAVQYNHPELIAPLVIRGFDVNVKKNTTYGTTPIMWANETLHSGIYKTELITELLRCGAYCTHEEIDNTNLVCTKIAELKTYILVTSSPLKRFKTYKKMILAFLGANHTRLGAQSQANILGPNSFLFQEIASWVPKLMFMEDRWARRERKKAATVTCTSEPALKRRKTGHEQDKSN